jgi:hypothetical protein
MIKIEIFMFVIFISAFLACSQANNSSKGESDVTTGNELNNEPVKPVDIEADRDKYLITDSMIGPFKLGAGLPGPATMMKYQMRVEQITRQSEDGPTTESVTIIAENNEDLLWLKPGLLTDDENQNHNIYEIIVLSPKYRTKEKIGVGSTIFDFQKTYPDYRVWYTFVSDMFVLESDTIKAQFILDKNDYTGPEIEIEGEITPLLTSDFKNNGKIKRVRLIRMSNS